jgi:hypothetical protein
MSQDVAVIGAGGEVVAINIHPDDYEPQPYEVVVTGAAWVGGDYVAGYFYPPQPFPSWTRQEGDWKPPTPKPVEGGPWYWDEDTTSWVESVI